MSIKLILIESNFSPNEIKKLYLPAEFHWFHKWTKWYIVSVSFDSLNSFAMLKQQRHCLICNKTKQSEIKNAD